MRYRKHAEGKGRHKLIAKMGGAYCQQINCEINQSCSNDKPTEKATIIKIGSFNSEGRPVEWEFDCHNNVPAIQYSSGALLYGGYSINELRALSESVDRTRNRI